MEDHTGNISLQSTAYSRMVELAHDGIEYDPDHGLAHIEYRSNSLPLTATFEQRRADVLARAKQRDEWEPGVSWPTGTSDPSKPTREGLTWKYPRHQRDVQLGLVKPLGKTRRRNKWKSNGRPRGYPKGRSRKVVSCSP